LTAVSAFDVIDVYRRRFILVRLAEEYAQASSQIDERCDYADMERLFRARNGL